MTKNTLKVVQLSLLEKCLYFACLIWLITYSLYKTIVESSSKENLRKFSKFVLIMKNYNSSVYSN